MDGSILAELLLSKGHLVFGLVRRNSPQHLWRIDHLLDHPQLTLIEGDITHQHSIHQALQIAQPQKVFHLAADSFVPQSWDEPIPAFHVTTIGTLNILEAIKYSDRSIKFYQSSSSEMFGKAKGTPQNETTPFHPISPYGIAKLAAHLATNSYAEKFGIHASSAILFNHEHERRGEQFVTRKITLGVAHFFAQKLARVSPTPIQLGNLDSRRDWGYAEDYVDGMCRILNHPTPETFVLATGVARTVREWCEETVKAAQEILNLTPEPVKWSGSAENEIGFLKNEPLFIVSQAFYRPIEATILRGDATKARAILSWRPATPFTTLVTKMVRNDLLAQLKGPHYP